MTYGYIEQQLSEVLEEIGELEKEGALQGEIDYLNGRILFYESLGDTESTAYAKRLHKKYDDLISIKCELTAIKEDLLILTRRLKLRKIHELKYAKHVNF